MKVNLNGEHSIGTSLYMIGPWNNQSTEPAILPIERFAVSAFWLNLARMLPHRPPGGIDSSQSCNPSAVAKASSFSRTVPLWFAPSSSGRISVVALAASRSSTIAFTGPTDDADSDIER